MVDRTGSQAVWGGLGARLSGEALGYVNQIVDKWAFGQHLILGT